jgi:peptide/nickel transport system substrate-binding protein
MFNFKRVAMLLTAIMLLALAACQPQTQVVEVEVTRVITETVTEVVEGETVEVEVTRVVEVAPEEEAAPVDKDLIVCMAQEPSSLYVYGGSMLVQTAVMHAIFENNFTTLGFDYQAQGVEKLPSLADGDAVLNSVEVVGGEMVVDATGTVITLTEGVEVINSAGETVAFDGTPVMMDQLVVDFTLKPRVWSDGEPVKASDSVYSFNVAAHPDTPASKFSVERTASYEATGDLTLQWTGVPGFRDSTYFLRMWTPLPEHLWGELSPAEMVDAEQVARAPIGDGAFALVEWRPGESIYLERNENYYRAAEGLPYLDSVTYKFVPDTNTLVAQLISGECDIATQDGGMDSLSPFLKQAEANGLIIPYFTTGTVYEHLDFNVNPYGEYADSRPDWFEDVRVRQAMTMCVNRQSLVDTILYGESEVIHTYIPSIHPLYPEDITEWPYDVEAANALLDEVGFVDGDGDGIREYTDGTPFAITLGTTAGNEMRQKSTQIIQSNFKDCGINAELYYLPSSEWFADGPDGPLFGRRYDLGLFAWLTGVEPACNLYLSSEIPGPAEETNPFTGQPYTGWGASNNTGWSSPEFDAVCQAALGSLPGTPEYEENHKEAQRIFAENVPIIPLFLRLKVAAARTNVVNFSVDPTENSELYNIFEFDLR